MGSARSDHNPRDPHYKKLSVNSPSNQSWWVQLVKDHCTWWWKWSVTVLMLLKYPFLLPYTREQYSALLQFAVLIHQTIFLYVYISVNRCCPKATHSGKVYNRACKLTLSAGFLSVPSAWLLLACLRCCHPGVLLLAVERSWLSAGQGVWH